MAWQVCHVLLSRVYCKYTNVDVHFYFGFSHIWEPPIHPTHWQSSTSNVFLSLWHTSPEYKIHIFYESQFGHITVIILLVQDLNTCAYYGVHLRNILSNNDNSCVIDIQTFKSLLRSWDVLTCCFTSCSSEQSCLVCICVWSIAMIAIKGM